jgi:hypothetical protein
MREVAAPASAGALQDAPELSDSRISESETPAKMTLIRLTNLADI